MAKFDVNKIIEESLNEASLGEKIYDKLHPEDPNSPENIAFKHAQGFSKAANEGDVEKTKAHAAGLRRFFKKPEPVDDQLRQETIRDALAKPKSNALVYGSEEYNKIAKEKELAGSPEVMKKAIASDAAKETAKKAAEENETKIASEASKKAANEVDTAWNKEASEVSALGRKAIAKNTEDTTSVLSHLGKSARKVGDDIQSGVKSFGHKVGDHLGNLDYGKTGMLAGGAIAAGLGALALRRRMKKAQKG
jgi:hypothetical protein